MNAFVEIRGSHELSNDRIIAIRPILSFGITHYILILNDLTSTSHVDRWFQPQAALSHHRYCLYVMVALRGNLTKSVQNPKTQLSQVERSVGVWECGSLDITPANHKPLQTFSDAMHRTRVPRKN